MSLFKAPEAEQARLHDDGGVSEPAWLSAADRVTSLPAGPVVVIDCEPLGAQPPPGRVAELAAAVAAGAGVVIGRCSGEQVEALQPLAARCTVTIAGTTAGRRLPAPYVAVADAALSTKELVAGVVDAPRAAAALADLLRATDGLDVRSALFTESATYSMLLAGGEFARWRAGRPRKAVPDPGRAPVLVDRDADVLTITLDQPARHNAFNRWMRDALCEALDIAILDDSVRRVRLRGAGASFCSGGDLDEFGTQHDTSLGHAIRLQRSAARRLHQLGDRAEVELHGACIGAGIELAAFAPRVRARDGAWFQLPEVGMGLIPGAGGTVSLPRRIGRWRTAWLAITGSRLDLDTALAWGLVDERVG